jgi:hypothetical protein
MADNFVIWNGHLNSVTMNMRILRGTLFGGIAYFLLGWLIYGILFMDFFSANMNQCAGRPEGVMVWWALILSNLTGAFLLTLILKWYGAKKIADGLTTGALFGFLLGVTMGLSFWSMSTMYNNFGVLVVDVCATTLMHALVGLVIVWLWGKEESKE